MDTEQKFLELQKAEELEAKRRETVLGFLDARASMLQTTVDNTVQKLPKQVSPALKSMKEGEQPSEDESSGVGKPAAGEDSTPKANLQSDGSCNSLDSFLEDESSFGFETSMVRILCVSQNSSSLCSLTCLLLSVQGDIHAVDANAMARFDENIARRLEHTLGTEATSSCKIDYRVLGSSGGIAMNKDGSAFARIEHFVSTGGPKDEQPKMLLSSLVSFEFNSNSHLIKSVAWCILKDGLGVSGSESVNGSKSDSTAKESLESQTVYPSVVSFDEAHRDKAKDKSRESTPPKSTENAEQMENPGMSI